MSVYVQSCHYFSVTQIAEIAETVKKWPKKAENLKNSVFFNHEMCLKYFKGTILLLHFHEMSFQYS